MEIIQDILAAIGVVLNGIPQGLLALTMVLLLFLRLWVLPLVQLHAELYTQLPPFHSKQKLS